MARPDPCTSASQQLQTPVEKFSLPDQQPAPSLTGMPREIRDQIYDHLLVAYSGPEMVEDAFVQANFCIELFAVSQQIRDEAIAKLHCGNIFFTVSYVNDTPARNENRKSLLCSRTQIRFHVL